MHTLAPLLRATENGARCVRRVMIYNISGTCCASGAWSVWVLDDGATQAEGRCSNTTQPQRPTSKCGIGKHKHSGLSLRHCSMPVHRQGCLRTQPQGNEWSAHLSTGADCSARARCHAHARKNVCVLKKLHCCLVNRTSGASAGEQTERMD